MDYLYLIFKCIAAGVIIIGVTQIVQITDPKYGGILAAAPIITTIAFIFTNSEAGQKITRELVLGSFYFAIPTLFFVLALYLLMGRYSFLPSICGAYLIWLVGVLGIQRIIPGI